MNMMQLLLVKDHRLAQKTICWKQVMALEQDILYFPVQTIFQKKKKKVFDISFQILGKQVATYFFIKTIQPLIWLRWNTIFCSFSS